MSSTMLLLLRRDARLWGVARAAVRSVAREPAGVRVTLDAGELHGDELAMPPGDLPTHRAGAISRGLFAERVDGFTFFHHEPVLILDPSRPPRALLRALDEKEAGDEE